MKMKNRLVLLVLLLVPYLSLGVAPREVTGLYEWYQWRNSSVEPDGHWNIYWNCDAKGIGVYGWIETQSPDHLVDVYVVNSITYGLWRNDMGGLGNPLFEEVHTKYLALSLSGEQHVVLQTVGDSAVEVDVGMGWKPGGYTTWAIHEDDIVLESNEFTEYVVEDAPRNTRIYWHLQTYFTTDYVDVFIIDQANFEIWQSGGDAEAAGLWEDIHLQSDGDNQHSGESAIFYTPHADDWHVVVQATDEPDTVSLAYGISLNYDDIITDTTTTTTSTITDTSEMTTTSPVETTPVDSVPLVIGLIAIGGIVAVGSILFLLKKR
ncbi:MAG: hypothetical protein RTU30_08300 [Candidatus Thorarchaeota archaeon]